MLYKKQQLVILLRDFDKETGTYYLRARYYNPATGRFISQDSYTGTAGDPLSLNLYTYCGNNPILFIDPTGNTYITSGDCGEEVTNLQNVLIKNGYSVGKYGADGKFGQDTYDAVVRYQKNYRLGADGVVGDTTWASLNNILFAKAPPPSESGYESPKKGPKWDKGKSGWVDKSGNVWVPDKSGHGGEHWDVQYPSGGYDNVYPDGNVRAGKGGRGKFSPADAVTGPIQGPIQPILAPTPVQPNTFSSGSSESNIGKAIASASAGTILYWGISELTRLIPIRNAIPIP